MSTSEENSDESDADSAEKSKSSRSSKYKEKEEKMFTESMGVNVKDMDKPLTQDALVAISMLERKRQETRTEA